MPLNKIVRETGGTSGLTIYSINVGVVCLGSDEKLFKD